MKRKATGPLMKKSKSSVDRNELFDIISFYMGQGDCSLIRCPDGKIVMIDCGSKADFQVDFLKIVADQVRDPAWAGKKMRIDALILTHKDQDHYNQVRWVLSDSKIGKYKYPQLKIDKVYFSWAYDDDSALGRYTVNGINQAVYDGIFKTSELYEVTICSEDDVENFYKKWTSNDGFEDAVADATTNDPKVPIAGREYTLFSGKTSGGKDWSVSLIAGNVLKEKGPIKDLGEDENGYSFTDGATEDNARSLITLLEIDGKKALFCGDATFSTEHFLVKSQSTLISNVQFLLAPHHGSEWASSSSFVDAVNPKQVVVSASYMEHTHKHPRKNAVTSWLKKVTAGSSHHIDYWEYAPDKANKTWDNWEKTKTTDQLVLSDSGNFMSLAELPGANIYYGVSMGWGRLYRAEVSGDLKETAFAVDPLNLDLPQFLNYRIG